MDVSKITLRMTEKQDRKGDEDVNHTIAKLAGNTLDILQRCLVRSLRYDSGDRIIADAVQYKPTELVLKGTEGALSRVTVSLKYLPVKMQLDPSESINNMGNLRVDVLNAENLPAADRNGYSDPYCKFELNGQEVYKTKILKKTLNPAWNEFFECPVRSRTGADFKVKVMDWDFADKADFLGEAAINLELLDPFKPQDVILRLDGKSGTIRLRLLFKPDYVIRSRQGSSTFSGTFATPGKIVGAPVKGVGMVGGGVVKGASFLRHGFKGKKTPGLDETNEIVEPEERLNGDSIEIPKRGVPITNDGLSFPQPMPQTPPHTRSRSFGAASAMSEIGGTPAKAEFGTATLTVLSASGYPPSANVRVHIWQMTSKGPKDVHKTKSIKSPAGVVQWDHETFKVNCTADTQFQVQVKDHAVFGSSDELGEGLFFVDDSAAGGEKTVKAGQGSVQLKTSFQVMDGDGLRNSPKSVGGARRSLLNRKDPGQRTTSFGGGR